MPASEDPTTRTSSVLSRLKSPFKAKTRSVADFFVEPDDPHRQYAPGDVVSGRVILKVVKPLRVTHITACLHGFVQVYKAPNSPAQSYREYTGSSEPGKTARTGYFGNGFASLFQDEVILCGEGRLREGVYQFGYELIFPKERLPSSIDFERGTISYMVTSTLTKPTTINPTMVCDRPFSLVENLDIATLKKPKPRIITLEPVLRKSKTDRASKRIPPPKRSVESDQNPQGSSQSEASSNRQSVLQSSSQADGDSLMSPAASEISCDSTFSSGHTGSDVQSGSLSQSQVNGSSQAGAVKALSKSSRPISATIELSRQGFLRGDPVHLRIFIKHRKLVKSVHGVIVTLYRQAHVDMHPALPVIGKDGQNKAEDYYPKSKTGLGGLSLTSAGSSHVFRKDLAQTFAPLLVRPDTLTADIKAAVRVPDDAFPTISTVPGAMISFKYFVEVVLDLQGKLQGLDRLFPTGSLSVAGGPDNVGLQVTHIIDTQEIRREKSVVSCVFEVVVGTKDTQRNTARLELQAFLDVGRLAPSENGNGNGTALEPQVTQIRRADPVQSHAEPETQTPQTEHASDATCYSGYENNGYHNNDYAYDYAYDPYYDPSAYDPSYHNTYTNGHAYDFAHSPSHPSNSNTPLPRHLSPPPLIPPPPLEDESQLPEKERLRRAEARLLPSQPPDENGDGGADAVAGPSTPFPAPHQPFANIADTTGPSEPPLSTSPGAYPQDPVPEYSGPSSSTHAPFVPPMDDKHELHRRRLEMERSAPPDQELQPDSEPRAAIAANAIQSVVAVADEPTVVPETPRPLATNEGQNPPGLQGAAAASSTASSATAGPGTIEVVQARNGPDNDASLERLGSQPPTPNLPRYEQ